MKLAITLDGTDAGRSGLGTYARGILPGLLRTVRARGGEAVVFGLRADFAAYESELGDVQRVALPDACASPLGSALWHMGFANELAHRLDADVLLLPAANRRTSAFGKVKTVAVIHDLAQLHVSEKYDAARMAYARHVLPRALARATRIVVPSQATARDVERVLDRTARVVPNGVDVQRFTAGLQAFGSSERLGLGERYLFYPSRLEHPGKNHLRLIRAYAASAASGTHDLVLAGPDWGALGAIREEIARLSLSRVRVLGRVDEQDLVDLVRGADAVVVPGLFEGFGLPALEALACGRPVAVSSSGALPEVVGPLGVLFDPLDERSMAAAIDRVVQDEAVRHRASCEGPQWARARDWSTTVAGLVDACEEALAA